MGNKPSECYMGDKLKCCKCTKVLPPCKSFSDFYQSTIHGRYVYVYNGGEYYRPVGYDNLYECNYCFYKPIRDQEKTREEERKREERKREEERRRGEERKREEARRREEERKREEERRREEERKREEERRREEERKMKEEQQRAKVAEEKKRQEELNQRLEESYRQAQEQNEKLSKNISEEHESKCHVLKSHLNEFEANNESGCDDLLESLSSICSIPVSNLSLTQLTSDQLKSILLALDKLLFDEWISSPPSLTTVQHAQVFITELCVLSLEISEVFLQSISNHVQSLLGTISESACNASQSFLLAQALYLNLMHFTNHGSYDSDAALIAKRWAKEEDLSFEDLFLVEFLCTLTSSLENVVEKASMFILKMESQCLKLLLFKLTHLNGKEGHTESSEMLLRLVQKNQWTPAEAVSLLKALSEKYAEDAPITEVLTLVQVYDISPEWTDDSGHSLIQALDVIGPERFQLDFQKILRKQDESSIDSALAELIMFNNLDGSVTDVIKNITTGVLKYSENNPTHEPFMNDYFKCTNLNADDIQSFLSQLCKAVFDTKGWWPTVLQMLRWCVLVLTETNRALELAGDEDDPCVIAMFAATQVCMGNKLDIVLSSDVHSHEQTKEWSDFYKHLGISYSTNMQQSNATQRNVYEADIVYGTMDDFVSDYFQYGLEMMETGNPDLSRRFIIKDGWHSAYHNLSLPRLKKNYALMFAAEILQSFMGNFYSEDMELRQRFIKALFQVLHTNINNHTGSKIITILQKHTGKQLLSSEVYILNVLESLLNVFTGEIESEKNRTSLIGKLYLESLFACAVHFQDAKEQTKELFQMASNLVAQQLWSPVDVLNLFAALSDHHHNEDCISIMKVLHLIKIYQVSSEWTDEKNQSLIKLLKSSTTENLIKHLEKSFRFEKEKSIECLFDEIRQMKNIDERTLEKSYSIVKTVQNLITSGKIKKHTDVLKARTLSHSTDTEDLQEILAVLCNAVHLYNADGKWWPRATQMISWCLLALSETGKLLEMGTGEGKSCVIAMFAVLRALRGEKVDVVSSSSVLCQRDAEEWNNFYKFFGITADTNINKTKDEDRKECYKNDVVYGTIEAFAADHLRQIFEMKDVRTDRSYQCIIIDEVDSLLLDQGVQLTYLSSPMVSLQHLNVILAMIWGHVSQYGFLSTGHQTFVHGPSASFFKAIFDSIDTENINDPMDILQIAEVSEIVPKGFTEDIHKSEKDELLRKLKTVSQEAMVNFFQEIESYIPYCFTVYTLDDNGLLCLRKPSIYNNQDIPDLTFLVLEDGLCCALYDSEEILIKTIAELISGKIQYTPCINNKDKISIPGFLENLIEKKLSAWVQNAFLAKKLKQGREYVVENDSICPVDFRSTGIIELDKKWGDGLQQFVEIKHQIKLSTISTITNYISHISFFEKYQGKIYGTTGTLGSETDMLFLQDLYPNLSACKMPTFNRRKLFEVKGSLKTSSEEWKSEIKNVIMAQIYPNPYRQGRAALVICETINTAKELYEELKSSIPGEIILYSHTDKDSLSKIEKELQPGDVLIGTNLAGRGTDIKVSKKVNRNGGLFVILSFLSDNTRVELQAFGRTARKGKPGSAQVIMTTDHLHEYLRTVTSLEEAKDKRDKLAVETINDMKHDVTEMKLREDLFSEYCKTLQDIHSNTNGDEQRAVVAIMNEFWGIWLQTKSEEIDQLKSDELQTSLKADLSEAKRQSQSQTSPCSSIYHYIKFGNIALGEKHWDISMGLFKKAMEQDESWAAIAFYNHAYCTIKQQKEDYIPKAIADLNKAQESLKYLSEECIVCMQFVKMSSANSDNSNPTSLEKQLTTKCMMLSYFDKNIREAIEKLDDIKARERHAVANKSPMFSLVPSDDEALQVEAYNLYSRGMEYVFAVEEEPRFPWGALCVFLLGVLEIIGGALLIAFTVGTLAQIGMGLITEGISDSISAIESMVTGEFSWKMWAMEKAISIGISIIGFGIGKLVANNFKFFKLGGKLLKELKSIPKFLSRGAKDGLSLVTRQTLKNTVKYTAKKMVEEIAIYGLGKGEEYLLKTILSSIKCEVKKGIVVVVKSNMEKKSLDTLVDSILFSYLDDKQHISDLLGDENSKNKLLDIFRTLSNTALKPFNKDLSWQHKLSSSVLRVFDKAKSEVRGKKGHIFTAIKVIHMTSLAADASITVHSLSNKFFSNLHKEMDHFEKERKGKNETYLSEKVEQDELTATETEMLKKFKQDLADTIIDLLADALVDVFHQKFSSHAVSWAQNQINGIIANRVRICLKNDRTEEKIRAGQNSRYITYMNIDLNSKHKLTAEAVIHSHLHAEKIRDSTTAGTILDIRVLSERTGTKVVILTKDRHGKPTKMQELNPSSKPATQTVTLIYTPRSEQHPDGHYDVFINNQIVSVSSEGKSCLFHSLALGMKPRASKEEIALEVERLRSLEADTLLRHPVQWEPFIKRKELTDKIRGGDWYMLQGAAPKKLTTEEEIKVLTEKVGYVVIYKDWIKYRINNPGHGQIMNADHQPPVNSILQAINKNQNSNLAKAMVGMDANSSSMDNNLISNVKKLHGREILAVCVPTEIHREFLSTKSQHFRDFVAKTISQDDVLGTFKYTIIGSLPRCMLDNNKNFNDFQNSDEDKTRLRLFTQSLPQHSKNLVHEWSKPLQVRGVMTDDHVKSLEKWIDEKGYIDPNDPHRKEVSRFL